MWFFGSNYGQQPDDSRGRNFNLYDGQIESGIAQEPEDMGCGCVPDVDAVKRAISSAVTSAGNLWNRVVGDDSRERQGILNDRESAALKQREQIKRMRELKAIRAVTRENLLNFITKHPEISRDQLPQLGDEPRVSVDGAAAVEDARVDTGLLLESGGQSPTRRRAHQQKGLEQMLDDNDVKIEEMCKDVYRERNDVNKLIEDYNARYPRTNELVI